jgi:hypothetical protein
MIVIQKTVFTRRGVDRILKYAFELARSRPRGAAAGGRCHAADPNFDNCLTHTCKSRAIRLYAKILVAARIVADPTPVSRVLEQPDVSPDLPLVSWRIEHGLAKVVFAHDPARWLKFRRRCFGELDSHDEVRKLRAR